MYVLGAMSGQKISTLFVIFTFLQMVLMINSCVNPLIYSNLHTSFRRTSLKLLCSCVFERFKGYQWDQMGDSIRSIVRRSSRSVRGSFQSTRGLLKMRRKSTESVLTIAAAQDNSANMATMMNPMMNNKNGSPDNNRNIYNNGSINGRINSIDYDNGNNGRAGSLASSISLSRKSLRCQLLSKHRESSSTSIDYKKNEKQRHSTMTSTMSPSPDTNTQYFTTTARFSLEGNQCSELVSTNNINTKNSNGVNNHTGALLSSSTSADSSISAMLHLISPDNNDFILKDDVFECDQDEAMPLTTVGVTVGTTNTRFTHRQKRDTPQTNKDGHSDRLSENVKQRRLALQSMREQSTIEEIL